MKSKVAPRSSRVPELAKQIASDITTKGINFKKEFATGLTKEASAPVIGNRVPISDIEMLGDITDHGLGIFEASSNGLIWRVVKTSSGDYLERDDELSAENILVNELMEASAAERRN